MAELLARRVAGFGTTIFTEMSALALQHGAVNLGQGFPDFPGPDFIKQAAIAAINADLNQYAPMPGIPRLRQALANQWEQEHGHPVDWQHEVTITSGATEALLDLTLALLNPGDQAIILEPAYDAYAPDITMVGGIPIPVRLIPPSPESPTWKLDATALEAAFAKHPKCIFLNTPHNPTGKVFTHDELALIANLCQQYDVIAICDEVYDRMVYDQHQHRSLASLPGMWERTLTLNSTGKTFGVTGWKIGWAIGAARLNHALRQSHQWVTFATSTPMQEATAVAIEQAAERNYYQQLRQEYDQRRQLLAGLLRDAGLTPLPVEGAYFMSCDISQLGFEHDQQFCRWLISNIGVVVIPTSVFYTDPRNIPQIARFCFAKRDSTLRTAGERLRQLSQRIRS